MRSVVCDSKNLAFTEKKIYRNLTCKWVEIAGYMNYDVTTEPKSGGEFHG